MSQLIEPRKTFHSDICRTYFIEKARQFQHLRELVRPSGSIIVDPLVGKSGTDLPKLPEEGLDAAGDDASDSEPATKIDVELESISEIEAASDVEITSDILIAREVSAHETASTPDAAADALFTPNLLYNSGEAVTLGDLVIRVRIEEEIKNGINKLNKLDVYDGPWVVSELPFSGATTSGGLFEDDGNDIDTVTPTTLLDGMLPPEGKHKLMHEMQQKLVKLDFPNTSKAEPWTKLVRLRPVYGLHTGAASKDARNAYQQLRESNESTIVNVNTSDIDFDSDDPTGVARIQEEAYVFLQYITFEPVGEDTFEVEKVRGKNLWRYPMEDCEDSVTDCTDPMILRYLGREGGYVKEDEVLMVKYLVRWAGWPSEDDTWEVGHGNIPQNLLEEYDTNVGDIEEEGLLVTKAITDMTRDFKSTGRIQKKPKTTSMRNKKRKSAAEGPVVTNFDSEDAKHETKNKSKRRASVPLVKATQRPKTD